MKNYSENRVVRRQAVAPATTALFSLSVFVLPVLPVSPALVSALFSALVSVFSDASVSVLSTPPVSALLSAPVSVFSDALVSVLSAASVSALLFRLSDFIAVEGLF